MTFTGSDADRLAIRDLLDTYADAVTQRNPEAWAETWAEDARWEMPDYPQFPPQEGRDNIVKLWTEAMQHYPGILFHAWPGSIEIDGNTAKMRSYTTETYDQDGNTVRDRGEYRDELVKIDGRWYFTLRSFRNIHKQIGPKGA